MADFHTLVEDVRSAFDTGIVINISENPIFLCVLGRSKNIDWRIEQLKGIKGKDLVPNKLS